MVVSTFVWLFKQQHSAFIKGKPVCINKPAVFNHKVDMTSETIRRFEKAEL